MAKVGRPLKIKKVDELKNKINEYFEKCDKDNRPYTITGLALALDIDRDTLLNYEKKEEYFGTIKRAKQKVEEQLEISLYGNSVTGIIFNLKNNFGWKDKQEIESNINANINNPYKELSTEDLKKLAGG